LQGIAYRPYIAAFVINNCYHNMPLLVGNS
jgi:hypothetical protein